MSSIHQVSRSRHGDLRWRRVSDHRFTGSTILAPLAIAEVTRASLAYPLTLLAREGGWTLAAVLGFRPGQNLYVGPGGEWTGTYVPAIFRAYPFRMGWTPSGEQTLCLDEGSGLLTNDAGDEPFFDEAGNLSAAVDQIWTFLREAAQSEAHLAEACGALGAADLIEPWPVTLEGNEGLQAVDGLHRVNEVALKALDDAALLPLLRAGIVGLAYAQILSTGHLANLATLARIKAQAEEAARARSVAPAMLHLPDDNTIDWDWSKIGRR